MKSLRAFFSLLVVGLALVSVAEAKSDNTAVATQGTLSVVTSVFGVPSYTFQFSGSGFHVPSLGSEDFVGYSNILGATFQQITQATTLFFTVPIGELNYNGQTYQWFGSITFTVGTFHYSFDKNGNLNVWGSATPSGTVTPCDLQNCIITTGPTISFGGTWHYRASFSPIPANPGLYSFSNLTVSTVPEPSGVVLSASGIIILGLFMMLRNARAKRSVETL